MAWELRGERSNPSGGALLRWVRGVDTIRGPGGSAVADRVFIEEETRHGEALGGRCTEGVGFEGVVVVGGEGGEGDEAAVDGAGGAGQGAGGGGAGAGE